MARPTHERAQMTDVTGSVRTAVIATVVGEELSFDSHARWQPRTCIGVGVPESRTGVERPLAPGGISGGGHGRRHRTDSNTK